LGTPVLITNTHNVGVVRDAVIEWNARRGTGEGYSGDFSLPLVAETGDSFLNDINRNTVPVLPHERLRGVLKKYNRLVR